MSLIGKGSSSLRKKDVMEQKGIALGFKKVRFAHKATAGDAGINLNALVLPSEMAAHGFLNPNAQAIAASNLNFFRNNLKLVSSLRGLLVDQLSYIVASSTQINFIDFTAEDGEIFTGWFDEAPTTSLSVVDGRKIIASGTLLAGQTDFNIGTPITINENSSAQIGAVMVFADRGLQYRKVGNISTGDGDYIEVPVAGGLGSIIRFNASGVDRFITVVSNGVVAERPDGSMMAAIERVQGQVDQMIPTLAEVAGVPETTFQTGPNNVDLKQFGDLVLNMQSQINTLTSQLAAKYSTANGIGKKLGWDYTTGAANTAGVAHIHIMPAYATSDMVISKLNVFLSANGGGRKIVMGVYNSVGGLPSTKLAQTAEFNMSTAFSGQLYLDLTAPLTLTANTEYFFVFHCDSTLVYEIGFNSIATGKQKFYSIAYSPTLPTTLGAPTGDSGGIPSIAGY